MNQYHKKKLDGETGKMGIPVRLATRGKELQSQTLMLIFPKTAFDPSTVITKLLPSESMPLMRQSDGTKG
jgi:hypothetical protein